MKNSTIFTSLFKQYNMKLPFAFTFLLCQFIAVAQTDVKKTKSALMGRWDWINTQIVDRSGGSNITPATCKCEIHLVFGKDGIIKEYRNDSLINNSAYSLKEYHFMNDPVKIILHSEFLYGQIKMNGDTIGIGPFGGCGAIQYFRKK